MNKRGRNKNAKKLPMIISGVAVLIIAVAVGIFMSTGKAEDSNEDIDMKEPTTIEIEKKVEYGDDIKDETFTIHMEDETREANFVDLDPEVDTMSIGKTEHQLELEDKIFDVTVVVEDTQKPAIKGVKDSIEFEDVTADKIEEELSKLITASDPVDGDLEVTFEIEPIENEENKFNVEAMAKDKNDNKAVEKFEVVIVKNQAAENDEDNKENNADGENNKGNSESANNSGSTEKPSSSNKSSNSNSSSNSSSNSGSTVSKPKAEAKPKPEPKPEPKPKDDAETDEFGTPKLGNPSGSLPSGASKYDDEISAHYYNYNRSLSSGSITTVTVYNENGGVVMIKGTDNVGKPFTAQYHTSRSSLSYIMSAPKFTDDDKSILYEVARSFASAYGM